MTKTKALRYQRKGIRKIEHFGGRALLADEMGLGKSFQALRWAQRRQVRLMIIVCPAGLRYNWEREAALHINMRAEVINHRRAPKNKRQLLTPHRIIILSYETLESWIKYLRKLKPELIVIDEAHYIKSRSAKRTRAIKRLCRGIPFIIGISGTPLTNRPAELFPIINILRPDVFPSFMEYAWKYCDPKRKPWGYEFKGHSNMAELNELLNKTCMIRRLKKDVLKDLPEKQRFIVPLDIENRKSYDLAVREFRQWIIKNKPSRKGSLKAEALTKMTYLKQLAGELKIKSVIQWIENFLEESDGKLILFGFHKKVLRAIHSKFRRISCLVDGSVVGAHRQRTYDKFQSSKRMRILVGNFTAAGIGWNGTAANTVAFVEMAWTPAEHIQAEDRSHRIGQTKGVSCFYLVGRNTIEERLCKLIQDKQEVFNAILDGQEAKDNLEVYELLLREIELGRAA